MNNIEIDLTKGKVMATELNTGEVVLNLIITDETGANKLNPNTSGELPVIVNNVVGEAIPNKEVPDATEAYTSDWADSVAYEASRVVKNEAGVVFGITGFNSRVTGQFIQIHNALSLPANNAVPEVIIYVEGSSNFAWDSGKFGKYFSTGIVICNSLTGPTKIIGVNDCWFNVSYK